MKERSLIRLCSVRLLIELKAIVYVFFFSPLLPLFIPSLLLSPKNGGGGGYSFCSWPLTPALVGQTQESCTRGPQSSPSATRAQDLLLLNPHHPVIRMIIQIISSSWIILIDSRCSIRIHPLQFVTISRLEDDSIQQLILNHL